MSNTDTISLQINKEQAPKIKAYYQSQIVELREKILPTLKEIDEYETLINEIDRQLKNGVVSASPTKHFIFTAGAGKPDVDKRSLQEKVQDVLRATQKQMTTREIINEIVKKEPHIIENKYDGKFGKFQKNLASTLKQKVDKGEVFFREANKTGDFGYGLKTINYVK